MQLTHELYPVTLVVGGQPASGTGYRIYQDGQLTIDQWCGPGYAPMSAEQAEAALAEALALLTPAETPAA